MPMAGILVPWDGPALAGATQLILTDLVWHAAGTPPGCRRYAIRPVALGSSGELIGAVAVESAFVYLALQVKQSTKAIRTSNQATGSPEQGTDASLKSGRCETTLRNPPTQLTNDTSIRWPAAGQLLAAVAAGLTRRAGDCALTRLVRINIHEYAGAVRPADQPDRQATPSPTGISMKPIHSLLVLALLLHGAPAFTHDELKSAPTVGLPRIRVLGQIEFPTTTKSPDAQAAFIRGMLLLHLFEYPFAEREFQQAEQLDPDFVMAYWGEAMTHNHAIWDQQDRDKALAIVQRLGPTRAARAVKTQSAKEKDFLHSVEVLYGDGTKAERDRAYMRAMAQMAQRYPDDQEVKLFYALSIMGVSAGVRDIPSYMEAAALAQSVFYANRRHPGAAHYLIHAVDDPIHAPLGLEAAYALAAMAPDAGHSLHMASHIFNALGMWNDVVNVNLRAVKVANAMAVELGRTPGHWGHYNFWLLYGLLQQGRQSEAKELLSQAYEKAKSATVTEEDRLQLDPDNSQVSSVVQMWSRYLLETGGTDREVTRWRFNLGDAFDPNLNSHYALGLLSSNPDVVASHLEAFRSLQAQLHTEIMAQPRQAPFDLVYLDRLGVIERELESALARSKGDTTSMIERAREASRLEGEMPYSFGPPFVDYPAAQWLGERLLDLGQNDAAAAAFAEQLKRSRQRTQALLGLARAERARGNAGAADEAMSRYDAARATTDTK